MYSSLVLSEAANSAIRLAAGRMPPGRALSTGAVFAALPGLDPGAGWERLWLESGEPGGLRLDEAPDTGNGTPAYWAGVPLTADLAAALRLVEELSEAYGMRPAPVGLLAVALVADPGAGAARGLTRHGLAQADLLELVQSEILGVSLQGLESHRPAVAPPIGKPAGAPAAPPAEPSAAPPAVPPGEAPATARPGLRRLGWISLSMLAVLGIILAVRTSPSFRSGPPPTALPPFPVPAVASHLVSTADVRAALGGGDVIEVQDRPPANGLWSSSSPFAADLLHSSVVGGWQREWSSADQTRYVRVVAIQVTQPDFYTSFRGFCKPATAKPTPGAARSGYTLAEKDRAAFCVLSEKGNVSVSVLVGGHGTGVSAAVATGARNLNTRQAALLSGYAAPSVKVRPSHYARDNINRWWILVAIVAPLLLVLPIALIDRATWRRVARRFRRRPTRDPFVVPVDPAARLALSEATALFLAKLAVCVWLLRACEVLLIGTYKTAAAVFAAFLLMSLAESRLLHRGPGRYKPRPFRGTSRFLAVGGLILTGAIVTVAFFVADLSLSLAGLGLNPAGPDYITSRLADVGIVVSFVILALAVLPLMLVRRIAMRRVRQEAQNSPGRHIVLLRSFADDKRRIRARRLDRASLVDRLCLRRWERFEEVVATALSAIGPVIALGRPGERLPPALGAVRQQYPMESWEDGVRTLITQSAAVCMVVGRTKSLVFELGEIKKLGALHRTLFLIPPCGRREQHRRLALLARELNIPWNRITRATRGADALLVVQNADPERALIFTGRAPDDVGYEAAIQAAMVILGQRAEATPVIRRIVADHRRGAAGVRPGPSTNSSPPPDVKVYEPGKAPVYVPAYRKFSMLPWTLRIVGSSLGALVPVFVIGVNLHDHPGVTTGSATAVSIAEDTSTGDLYASFDGGQIARVDLAKKKVNVVGTSTEILDDLIVRGDMAYGDSPTSGKVIAISLTTHKTLWTAQLSPGLRGLVLDGDALVTAVPGRHEVVALSARTGHRQTTRPIQGTPWGVAVSGNQIVVPVVDRGRLDYLRAGDLALARTESTVSGPQEVLGQGAGLWVLSPTSDQVVLRGGGRLLLSDPDGRTASSPGWFAVQGNERVTLVNSAGLIVRVPQPYNDVASICVTGDGRLFVGIEGKIAQLR